MADPTEHPIDADPPAASGPGWAGLLGFAAVVVFVAVLAVGGIPCGFLSTGDTPHLAAGTSAALDCIRHGTWTRCGTSVRGSSVHEYPLLQYLPAAVFRQVGLNTRDTVRALAWVNLAAFAALLLLLVRATRRDDRTWRPLIVMVAVSGPLLFYATSGFGEMLAATAILGFVVAARERRPVLIAVLGVVACLGKETLPPFLLVLGVLASRDGDDGLLPPRRLLVPLVAGTAVGTAASMAFNVFRFGTIRNITYLRPAYHVTGVGRVARNTFDLLVAPGGGLALFWPSFVLVALGFVAATVAAVKRRDARAAVPSGVVLLVAGAFLVALATWWAPFGWIAWGPRLFLPLAPALLVLAVHTGGDGFTALVRRWLGRPLRFAVVAAVCLLGAYAQASAPWVATTAAQSLLVRNPVCPRAWPPRDRRYWTCFEQRAWRLHDTPLRVAATAHGARTWLGRVVLLGGIAGLLLEARRRALTPGRC